VCGLALVFMVVCAWACWRTDAVFPYPLPVDEAARQRQVARDQGHSKGPGSGVFPYTENMITPWGAFAGSRFTGPFVVGSRPLVLGTVCRWLLTFAGCLAGAVLLIRVVLAWRWEALKRPLTLFTLFQVPFLIIAPDLYDRYFLFLLPGALALAWGEAASRPQLFPSVRWPGGLVVLAVLAIVSVGWMHDWLAWNSARWELGRRAVEEGKHPLDIEGGVEWDAWYAPPDDSSVGVRASRYPVLPFTKEWFPAIRGRYALSFSELPGTRRIDSEPYDVWLPPAHRQVILFEVLLAPDARKEGPPGSR
jgi:hypothetical protein